MIREQAPADHITPYDRCAWRDVEVERLLLSGQQQQELSAYFGPAEYDELRRLARAAQEPPPGAPKVRVFIVPGIMGSQLGLRRPAPHPHDVLWLDPIDIQVGKLEVLRLQARAPIVPLGIVLYTYLRLKLHLRASGFDPICYDYDWRLGVDQLGAALAERIREDASAEVMLVGHSMGGLVCRAALSAAGMQRVRRLVLLGTPNFGSFAPLQALRGTYAVVRRIAMLVSDHTAEALASGIFHSFPSLYHMLPAGGIPGALDVLERGNWPRSGPQPQSSLLRDARRFQRGLPRADARVTTVVGVGQETVTAVSRRGQEFVYTITRQGDGTVPVRSAALPGARNHYVPVAHSELTRDPLVAAAVTDLLRSGSTSRLPTSWRSRSLAQARISDRELRRLHARKIDWAALEPEARRHFLENLNEPPHLRLKVPYGAAQRVSRMR
ncbi:MAG: hypothetical protein JOZ93_05415 [Sinobacteraceae bacterium]|nr:hypothetical protein [Nevskiaceae bacterium]